MGLLLLPQVCVMQVSVVWLSALPCPAASITIDMQTATDVTPFLHTQRTD